MTVTFAPLGLEAAMTTPLLAAAFVVLAVGLISAPWSAWLVLREVIEPVTALRNGAVSIARGKHTSRLASQRSDEIGELAVTLDWCRRVTRRSARFSPRFRSLEEAYLTESLMKQEVEQLMRMKSDFVALLLTSSGVRLAVVRLYPRCLRAALRELARGSAASTPLSLRRLV